MKRILGRLRHGVEVKSRSLRYKFQPYDAADMHVIADIPYFAQWESPDLIADILSGKLSAADDPHWRKSGAKTKAEYERWSWSACGMACTKMTLAHATGKVVPIVQLGKRAQAAGVYGDLSENDVGLRYEPYLRFVWEEFGWKARLLSPMVKEDIIKALAKGYYVIVSVHSDIRMPSNRPKTRGGHLVLVTAYDTKAQDFYINNPSGDRPETQESARIPFKDFEHFFAHRGIIIDTNA